MDSYKYHLLKESFRRGKRELDDARRLDRGTTAKENLDRVALIGDKLSQVQTIQNELRLYRDRHFNPLKAILLNFIDNLYNNRF